MYRVRGEARGQVEALSAGAQAQVVPSRSRQQVSLSSEPSHQPSRNYLDPVGFVKNRDLFPATPSQVESAQVLDDKGLGFLDPTNIQAALCHLSQPPGAVTEAH